MRLTLPMPSNVLSRPKAASAWRWRLVRSLPLSMPTTKRIAQCSKYEQTALKAWTEISPLDAHVSVTLKSHGWPRLESMKGQVLSPVTGHTCEV